MNTLAMIAVVIALVVGVPVIIWGMAHRPGRNRPIEHGGTAHAGVVDRPEKRVIDPGWVNQARLHDVMPEEDLPRAPYDGPEPGDGR